MKSAMAVAVGMLVAQAGKEAVVPPTTWTDFVDLGVTGGMVAVVYLFLRAFQTHNAKLEAVLEHNTIALRENSRALGAITEVCRELNQRR
jgi:hypothetical protein